MGVCVGKPTLHLINASAFPELVVVDLRSGREGGERAGKSEAMSGADHGGNPFVALPGIRGGWSERSDSAAAGEADGRVDSLPVGVGVGFGAISLVDAGKAQLVLQPPLAVPTRAQGSRFPKRIRGIVDIAEGRQAVGESRYTGIWAVPAALADLAGEIGAELRSSSRIFADIAEREFLQRRLVQRPYRLSGFIA
jgi:hypothetical protein